MKKIFIILGVSLIIASCGNGGKGENSNSDSSNATHELAASQNQNYQDTAVQNIGTDKPAPVAASNAPGAQLIAKSDCLGCHKEHDKLVGPAYADVAKKYTAKDEDMLADHIINGGAGHWGDVPMSPHPNLSKADAKEMVAYILTIK